MRSSHPKIKQSQTPLLKKKSGQSQNLWLKAFKYNKIFFIFKKTESSTKWAIIVLLKYHSRDASRFNLGSLFFLIYINNLSENLSSNPKLFADGRSYFSVVHNNLMKLRNNLNEDLKINNWVTQWLMSFNLDPAKQAQ